VKKLLAVLLGVWVCSLGLAAGQSRTRAPASPRLPAATPRVPIAATATQTDQQYCVTCHSERGKAGGLSLAGFDVSHPDTSEKMIRKLRAGMLPPAGARRPDEAAIDALRRSLEARMDQWAAANLNPGWRPFQRLTRAEYTQAISDLLAVSVDVSAFLPPDTMSQGFDNIADAQGFSPALPQGYLRAASHISRLAVGDPTAAPTTATYRVPAIESQLRYVEGTPFGSRGGIAVTHTFPADGLYVFQATLVRTVSGELFGNTSIYMAGRDELLEISVNGDRVAVIEVNHGMSDEGEKGLTLDTPAIYVQAGPQRIAAAFVPRSVGPVDDLLAPIDQTLIDQGRAEGGDFESGIRLAIQGMLANPRFLFRVEQGAATAAGQTYRLADSDLASRLSFFLGGTLPDAELLKRADDRTLRNPLVFEKQVKRMLADSRARALSTRFAAQWLRLLMI
jgi:Protein of unknown function (DUF1592)/Protein of unknown function (DUF1587)